ncbi:hypothetical protein [Streptacidiphilus sp. EB129]|uniref:hypothetical protein n=1 Tax=Streptacidiphilus sp. EB129 TaxID=3156262 RepID=UPI00351365FA
MRWTVTRTATSASGFAYRTELRTPDGQPGAGPDIGSDAQELFVRSGNVITLVQIQAGGTEIDPAGDAPQVLATMASRLGYLPQ